MTKNKGKTTKYMIEYTSWTKNLDGKIIGVKKIIPKRPRDIDKTKLKSTRKLLVEFIDKQEKFNTHIEKEISSLRSGFHSVVKLNNLKY